MSFFLFCEYQSSCITTSGGATGHGQVVQPEKIYISMYQFPLQLEKWSMKYNCKPLYNVYK